DVAAGRARARNAVLRAAMVAAQPPIRGVQHEVRSAASARGAPAAGFAGEHGRVAAPVDEYEALLATREPRGDRSDYGWRETILQRLLAQVDDAHDGKLGAGRGAARELEALVASLPEVVPALERRRGAAEDHRAARELRAIDRSVARRIAQAFLLLEGAVVLLVDDDEREP